MPTLSSEVLELLNRLCKQADLASSVTLQPHQKRFVQKVQALPPNAGILAYHGLGSGKTLSSIAAAESLGGKKEVVVPAALRENYRKELTKFVAGKPEGYHVDSYSKAVNRGSLPQADTTVFDEAQRMGRPESALSTLPAAASGRKIFLSGTPIRNEPSEIIPILKGIIPDRSFPHTRKSFDERFIEHKSAPQGWWDWLSGVQPGFEPKIKNHEMLKEMLKDRVDYHPSSGEFPTTNDEEVEVPMTDGQTDLYNSLMKTEPTLSYKVKHNLPPSKSESIRLNSFLNAVRQVSNNPASYSTAFKGDPFKHSPKMQKMFGEIERHHTADPNFRGVVYSNYLDSGIKPLSQKLNQAGIPNAIFTGEIADKERKRVIDAYNQGKLKVLLISGAGAEGLDLKGTKLVQLMEPHWNAARIQQVIGRAVRHQSHAHLPEDQRNVKIQRFFTKPTPSWLDSIFGGGGENDNIGADRYMHNLSKKKQQLIDEFLTVLKEVGSKPPPKV